ncbi:MAG: hypothetical protein Q9162_000474 [Coniocarpon cinnabarinum]
MAGLLRNTLFNPLLTGPLLLALTRGSPETRTRILDTVGKVPYAPNEALLIRSLKYLLAFGLVSQLNRFLTRLALNKWQLRDTTPPFDPKNEVCVITGGSGGIGSEIVRNLARTGMRIAIMDLTPPPADLKAYRNVHFYESDITKPEAVQEVAARIKKDLGTVSILLNNAGVGNTYNILDISDSYLEKVFHINLISHWYTVKAFLPDMIAAKKGHILSTASMASYVAVAGMVDYCVTKAGVMSFHEGLNQELKHRYNAPFIKTTAIHPYWVQTKMFFDIGADSLSPAKAPSMTPQYAGTEIAKAVLSGRSGHLILPKDFRLAGITGVRGWATWLHELANDGLKEITLKGDAKSLPAR